MTQPSPSPGVHGAPSAQPTQPAPSASTGMPNTGGNPGKLPTTGPDAGAFLIAGVLAVLGGALLARRARVRRGG